MRLDHGQHKIIQKLLIDLGLGTTPANPPGLWPVYWDGNPGNVDNLMVVYATQGYPNGRSGPDGRVFEQFGFQIRFESTTSQVGWTKASAVREMFETSVRLTVVNVDGTRYVVGSINNVGQIISLGKDVNDAKTSIHTLNAVAPIRQLP